jgi:lysozyme
LRGLDIASWQHPKGRSIDWSSVRGAGQSFVFIKATEGTRYRNPWFAADWSGSTAAGLMRGAYHFARPSRGSATAQARSFAATVTDWHAKGTLPPTLDLEKTGGLRPAALISWTAHWLSAVKRLTGRSAIIYSYPAFWAGPMNGTSRFSSHPLWGACYCSAATTFGGAWTHWAFWQFSSSHHINGISGRTDTNVFNG